MRDRRGLRLFVVYRMGHGIHQLVKRGRGEFLWRREGEHWASLCLHRRSLDGYGMGVPREWWADGGGWEMAKEAGRGESPQTRAGILRRDEGPIRLWHGQPARMALGYSKKMS